MNSGRNALCLLFTVVVMLVMFIMIAVVAVVPVDTSAVFGTLFTEVTR